VQRLSKVQGHDRKGKGKERVEGERTGWVWSMETIPRAIWGRGGRAGERADAGGDEQGKISRHLSLMSMNVCPLTLSSSRGHCEINKCARSSIVRKCLCVCLYVCVCVRILLSLSFSFSSPCSFSFFLSVSLCLCVSLSHCISVSLSVCICVSIVSALTFGT